jgi:hypothetical protein
LHETSKAQPFKLHHDTKELIYNSLLFVQPREERVGHTLSSAWPNCSFTVCCILARPGITAALHLISAGAHMVSYHFTAYVEFFQKDCTLSIFANGCPVVR